jgi:AraC-like DNA-binding protein
MLRAAEARVLDVGVACGFKSQQHFARLFRGMCGASPSEYRRMSHPLDSYFCHQELSKIWPSQADTGTTRHPRCGLLIEL